jgi:hypothetical protein
MPRFAKSVTALILLLLCSGCAQSIPTLIQTDALCRDWKVYKPAKSDKLSNKSARTLLLNNEARVVYGCKKLANEAA